MFTRDVQAMFAAASRAGIRDKVLNTAAARTREAVEAADHDPAGDDAE